MTAALTISGTLALALLPGAMEPETHFTRCWTVAVDSGEVFPTPERTPFTGFTELPDGRIAALNRDDAVLILDGSGSPLGSFQVQEKGLFPASNGILALGPADGPSLLVSVYRAGLKFFRPDGTWLATRPIAGFPVAGPMSFGTRGAAVLTSHDVFYLFSPSGRLLAREEMPFGAAFGGLATGPGRRIAIAGHAGRIRIYRWKARRLRLESEVELGDEISEPPAFGPDGSLYAITTREEWEPRKRKPFRYSVLHVIRGGSIRAHVFSAVAAGPPLPIPATGDVVVPVRRDDSEFEYDFLSPPELRIRKRYRPRGYVMDPAFLTRDGGALLYAATFSGVELLSVGGHLIGSHHPDGIVNFGPVELQDGRIAMAELSGALRFLRFEPRCLPRPGAFWLYPGN